MKQRYIIMFGMLKRVMVVLFWPVEQVARRVLGFRTCLGFRWLFSDDASFCWLWTRSPVQAPW
jgi:hypothetical protein